MRYLDDLRVTIKNATPLSDGRRAHLSIPGESIDEIWLVPAMFEGECSDESLPYRVRFAVEINPATSIAEIARLDIYQLLDGEPVHAAGLRHLPLATILQAAVRAAATFYTKDDALGGYVQTTPAKRPKPRSVARATDRRAGAKNRKNSSPAAEAQAIANTVANLKRRGVKAWRKQTCDMHGISVATLYRRLDQAAGVKKPKTKKRGK